jgi:tyrosyl-tRNA synthetase
MASDTLALLKDGTAEIVPAGGLEEKLGLGRPLRVKLGVDPTAADVTLGWAVVLRKLRRFQDAGHIAVLIVGDFTARVGDPSGKSETRPRLPKEVVQTYADRLLEQFGKILADERLEVRYNSEWLERLDMEGILRLTSSYTVARMLEREDFAKRYAEGRPISITEFMYPLFQGYDSVAIEADVELGGNDQLFNNLVGRDLQRDRGQEPQLVMTVPLLEGLDGVQKMSQSLGNYVGISEHPDEMFGKLMSIPDGLIGKYLRLCTDLLPAEVDPIEAGLADGSLHAGEQKRRLAREVVDLYHGPGAGEIAERHFDVVFKERGLPNQVPEAQLPDGAFVDGRTILPRLLTGLGLATSNSDGRRKVEEGAVRLDQEQKSDPWEEFTADELAGSVLQVGKRRFVRLTA